MAQISVDQQAIARITRKLRTLAQDAVKKKDVSRVEQMMLNTILMRTQRGEYLEGSKEPPKYSKSHARRRRKLGLQTQKVTLFMGEIGVLEGLKSESSVDEGNVNIRVGYIEGKTEAEAYRIASYLQEKGAGKNHVLYRHVGLTDSEEERIMDYLKQQIENNIRGAWNERS